MRSSPVQLNVCDLFYAILYFCARQKPTYCGADYAAACVADHQTPALCRKYPPRTYSYTLFSLFIFPMVKNISDMML